MRKAARRVRLRDTPTSATATNCCAAGERQEPARIEKVRRTSEGSANRLQRREPARAFQVLRWARQDIRSPPPSGIQPPPAPAGPKQSRPLSIGTVRHQPLRNSLLRGGAGDRSAGAEGPTALSHAAFCSLPIATRQTVGPLSI